jgi:hypothetical protein
MEANRHHRMPLALQGGRAMSGGAEREKDFESAATVRAANEEGLKARLHRLHRLGYTDNQLVRTLGIGHDKVKALRAALGLPRNTRGAA